MPRGGARARTRTRVKRACAPTAAGGSGGSGSGAPAGSDPCHPSEVPAQPLCSPAKRRRSSMAARAPAVASDGPAEATDGEEIILAGRAAQAQAPTPEQESEAWWRAVSGLGGSQAANAEEDDDDGAGDAFEDAPAHWFVAEAARATEHDFDKPPRTDARTATAPDEEAPGPVAGGHAGSAVELPPHEPPPHEPGIPALPLPPPPLPPGFLLPPRLPLGCVVEQRQDGSWELRASFDTRTAANRAMMAVMAAEPESEHAVSPREPCAATLPEPPTHTSRHQVAAKVLETAGGSGASLADSDEGSPHAAAEVAGKSPQEEPPATPAAAPPALPSPTSSLPWDAAKLKSANVMVLLDLDNWPSFFEKLPFELPKTGVLVAAFARKGGAGAPSGKKNGKKAAGSGSGLSVRSMTKNPAAQVRAPHPDVAPACSRLVISCTDAAPIARHPPSA